MVVSTLCRYIVKSPRLDGIYSIQCSVSPLFKCSFFWFLLLHHVPVAIVSVWAGKRCSLPRCLKSLFAPCKGITSVAKKISTPIGVVFFCSALAWGLTFCVSAQLLALVSRPCYRKIQMYFKKAFRRQLGRSLGAASRLGVLQSCSSLHLFMERHNTTPLHSNPSRQPLVLKRAARCAQRCQKFFGAL